VNVANYLIGNNAMALSAAASEAESRGYRVISLGSENTGEANAEGQALAARCVELRAHVSPDRPVCLLSGGEPVVRLVETERPGKGGRNQQLVLAALIALGEAGLDHFVILSGGTDGEDGSTDAAGAWADAELLRDAHRQGLDPRSYLQVNDAYTFFAQTGGLIQTGPTHTNVMDLRVALVWSVTGDG
jgi:glycerate-2-kinase